jgi:DNA mismatch repair protein MutS
VLAQLEQTDSPTTTSASSSKQDQERRSLPQPHPILDEVRQIDLFSMTPLDALNRLADLQRRAADPEKSSRQ